MTAKTTDNWDDLRFPFTGSNIDVNNGRLDYDYFNGGIKFQANARYPEEPVSMVCQLPHAWKEESDIHPHFHWIQQSSNIPNWLIAYKILKKNTTITLETNFNNYTLLTPSEHKFTYTSGNLEQITEFDAIDMTDVSLSDIIHFVMFRDSSNASAEFAGSDPSSLVEIAHEFDIHFQTDFPGGSRQEYIK